MARGSTRGSKGRGRRGFDGLERDREHHGGLSSVQGRGWSSGGQRGGSDWAPRGVYRGTPSDHHQRGRTRSGTAHNQLTPAQKDARGDYYAWKDMMKATPRPDMPHSMSKLWRDALVILNKEDKNWNQTLIRDLVNEEYQGLRHVGTLMSAPINSDTALCFLAVCTHSSLLNCLSVDNAMGGLYDYISGNNGTRAMPFLARLLESLQPRIVEDVDTAVAATHFLHEVLRREQRARCNEQLPGIVDRLQDLIASSTVGEQTAVYHDTQRCLERIKAVMVHASGIKEDVPPKVAPAPSIDPVVSTYPREQVMPGGRHDNDHADIAAIQIFPTLQEICYTDTEFLPTTNRNHAHHIADEAGRHIDVLFRLLRHDLFGQLKTALLQQIIFANAPVHREGSRPQHSNNVRSHIYCDALVSGMMVDNRRGLEIDLTFRQLPELRNMSAQAQTKRWAEMKRLEPGTLVCFLAVHEDVASIMFFSVGQKEHTSVAQVSGRVAVKVKLVEWTDETCKALLEASVTRQAGLLIELPGVLPETFMPILHSLQTMHARQYLPFRQLILPERVHAANRTSILPPSYARSAGFQFSLKAILTDPNQDLMVRPGACDRRVKAAEIQAKTSLDAGQAEALLSALMREFALIQGPPGTGKSYVGVQIMRVLLEAQSRAALGPIVVVCYTNHALDQFLEHLLACGIKRIIRIGGSSKSEALAGKNLRVVSSDEKQSRAEAFTVAQTFGKLEQEAATANDALKHVHAMTERPSWHGFGDHLKLHYRDIASQFQSIDADGFQQVSRKHPFDDWVKRIRADAKDGFAAVDITEFDNQESLHHASHDIHSLSHRQRRNLVALWAKEIREKAETSLMLSLKEADQLRQLKQTVHDEVDRRVLRTAQVIGLTTNGLARKGTVLQRLRSKVVICEEAGEVMEPHMMSALLPDVEHFIQIGDHEQLRPQINNYELSLESKVGRAYQLDRSQFERLSVGEPDRPRFPLAQLNVNRRMRPEISQLVRKTKYPCLVDHVSVKDLPDVVGMRKNVYWLNHDHQEDGQDASGNNLSLSKSNQWEAEMVHALVRHIVRQGVYRSTDVAVLTPYLGQLCALRSAMATDFEVMLSDRDQQTLAKEGYDEIVPEDKLERKRMVDLLRLATVDNFQGEEAKVVIVSLVRSNSQQKVGFLRTTNRINVLLSRAQHGMYLIGNAGTYENVAMWRAVIQMLQASDALGQSIALCCPRHKRTELEIKEPEDFLRLAPQGGCQEMCDRRLDRCGHRCMSKCHSNNMHEAFSCPQPCQRLHDPCGHSCRKATCGEDCGLCIEPLNDISLCCGHVQDNVPCYEAQSSDKICCTVVMEKKVEKCQHLVQAACPTDVNATDFVCSTPCCEILPCGHPCPGTCGQCSRAGKHQQCRIVCGRRSATCNHSCRAKCHSGKPCEPCRAKCEVRCAHSKCPKSCSEACAPCVERCTWSCEHVDDCSVPCGAPCDRLPCNKRCSMTLECGHQCPAVCGETCPQAYCHFCSDKTSARVDLVELKQYAEINVDETPIVVLGCGHFFTAESLDGVVGMSDVYTVDSSGEFSGLKDIDSMLAVKVPQCPDCQRPIQQYVTQRYNRVINRAVLDEMGKRYTVENSSRLRAIKKDVESLKELLQEQGSLVKQAHSTYALRKNAKSLQQILDSLAAQNKASNQLLRKLTTFCQQSSKGSHPAFKLHNAMIVTAREAGLALEERLANLHIKDSGVSIPQEHQSNLAGRVCRIYADHAILSQKFEMLKIVQQIPGHEELQDTFSTVLAEIEQSLSWTRCAIHDGHSHNLPRLQVQAIIHHAQLVNLFQTVSKSSQREPTKANQHLDCAKQLLREAEQVCKAPFQGHLAMLEAVAHMTKLLGSVFYEAVSQDEIDAIKRAMVEGSRSLATHSGHWYKCVNGHAFAIGECGMPMETARCPECGANIGGTNHRPVQGMTRAQEME